MADTDPAPITIKKYANRRLYDTAASRYVTLADLARMVRVGADFVVVEAKSGRDLTRTVLTQIIVEEDIKGRGLLSVEFLRQLIGFHGDGLHVLLSRYLDQALHAFAKNQTQIRRYVEQATTVTSVATPSADNPGSDSTLGGPAAAMWSPLDPGSSQIQGDVAAPNGNDGAARLRTLRGELADLRKKVDALSRQVPE